jgi:hypothetical protein
MVKERKNMKRMVISVVSFIVILTLSFTSFPNAITNAISSKSTDTSNMKKTLPFEKIEGKEAKKLIKDANETVLFNQAKAIIETEGFKLKGQEVAVRINSSGCESCDKTNVTDWVYFYVLPKDKKKSKNDLAKSFIAINPIENRSVIKLYTTLADGTLYSKTYENNHLIGEVFVNGEGTILDGSYIFKNNYYFDLTELNDKIKEELDKENSEESLSNSGVAYAFSWSKFWDCLKKNSKESLPLRAELLGACYYICLTGPASCITCTVINGGLTVGIASYCVYKAW